MKCRHHLAGSLAALLLPVVGLAAAGSGAQPATLNEYGPTPDLPAPDKALLPTLHVAKAEPWSGDAGPSAAPGLSVRPLARGLQHPRWLYTLPNGDVLVAESEAPQKPEDSKGVSGKVHKLVMKRAGSG